MTSLEKYRWQYHDLDSSFDRATSFPDGIHEISRFEPYLPRAVRRITSDEDVQRYKNLFHVAQRNQGFTWKEYLGILRGDLCQFYTQNLMTKALQRRLTSSCNSENLHNAKSRIKFRKKPVSKFKIAKRSSLTRIVEDSESLSSMEYAYASKTSFVKLSRRLASPRKEKTSHYVTASESKFSLSKYKITKNSSFVETEYTGDTDSVLSMEYNNTNNTSFVELQRRQASSRKTGTPHYVTASEPKFSLSKYKVTRNPSFGETEYTGDTDSIFSMEYNNTNNTSYVEHSWRLASSRKAETSHYVTASEPEFSLSKYKVTRNPSFGETEYTGDTDSVFSMEFGYTNKTSYAKHSKRLASPRKAGTSHYVTASEPEFDLSKYKVTRNPSFGETEYTGDTDNVSSMEFGNTNNASYVELSRRVASPRKAETLHYVTSLEQKVSLSKRPVTRNPSFTKSENVGETDSVCSMTCISMNSNFFTEDGRMKKGNASFSPRKNFLKKFSSGIRQFATKTKVTVGKLSKYCSELYPAYQNDCNKKSHGGCSQSALKIIDFNKPLTPDMLRDNTSPSSTISQTSVTPNEYYDYTVNPRFTEKATSSYKKKVYTKRMLPFIT